MKRDKIKLSINAIYSVFKEVVGLVGRHTKRLLVAGAFWVSKRRSPLYHS